MVQNAFETSEFVWNLVTEELGEQMNITSSAVEEFALAGPTPIPSRVVQASRLRESRADGMQGGERDAVHRAIVLSV